ncbi:toxin co-regulated pilus biosynthesis Q family protein (plasmid) [Paraburkholderia sprentiae WSM5005]|uniref:Toxin co-regulated pilus biosynthesis Q family protein n=1 Tax=Paraburkholderia sprentiae WSM5005 TaxID=754502 RepID=A0A1I9YW57_9BURK|nr:toxin co-regulated pilus biosynthesis Q family protein [Paraburkholderia sprentiae]APA90438.1 toxin co-regulated pilus biosynthesis Q family protein [Paraburkholderia sprentiae WSM5005]
MNVTIERNERVRVIARVLAALSLVGVSGWSQAAIDPDQSHVAPPAGDGWQILSAAPSSRATAANAAPAVTPAASGAVAGPTASGVASVVLPGTPTTPGGVLTLSIAPQDLNLRNALDRWLQTQGWQLAWKVDDDLPLEFNATFSGDFTSVLTQVMKATNHMRVPTRICRHTNNVIRVIARAANCQD